MLRPMSAHRTIPARRRALLFGLLPLLSLLGGCKWWVLAPAGDIAAQQRDLLVISTLLMLVIIVPVIATTILFAWRYRHSNRQARYEPDWDHSTQLELLIWAAPLLIIICLGAITWSGTHLLDPYRPLERIGRNRPVPAEVEPLRVEVVALDWKWLFIYPEQGVAAVNELVLPVDRPVALHISASSVMNAFYAPALAGMIYAMPAMETRLHAVLNRPGTYQGFSANYSGAGFSGMHFTLRGVTAEEYERYVKELRAGGDRLDRQAYLELERPSENVPVRHYGRVEAGLFNAVVNLCVEPGRMCQHQMMEVDARGGLGLAGIYNVARLDYDKHHRRGAVFGPAWAWVTGLCGPGDPLPVSPLPLRVANNEPLRGMGLPEPGR
ncbi:MAG: ubiquinol oxidase subunit II [Steroidobacteraceae bacterium]